MKKPIIVTDASGNKHSYFSRKNATIRAIQALSRRAQMADQARFDPSFPLMGNTLVVVWNQNPEVLSASDEEFILREKGWF